MATFLELVKDLGRESGTLDPRSITTVVDQTGRAEKMVGWVRKAWMNIQNSRTDWLWMQETFTHALIDGTAAYLPASLGITRWGRWVDESHDWFLPLSLYDPAIGVTDEGAIRQISYQEWFHKYGRNSHDENRPIEYAITPKGEIAFGPTPDADYMVRGQYILAPQELSANGDIPEMPTRFHDMITWEAQRLLLIHDGAYQESNWPSVEYARFRFDLEREQLPEVYIGGCTIG